MVCALLSDIHSNLEALRAVLRVVAAEKVDVVYCLGDLVGYNADPDSCVDETLAHAAVTVRGNHDKAVAGLLSLEWFNPEAQEAARWTQRKSSAKTIERLRRLSGGPLDVGGGMLLCHGTPMDEDEYMIGSETYSASFRYLEVNYAGVRVCFHGHTHVPVLVARGKERGKATVVRLGDSHGAETRLDRGCTYLVNPGSVGQPRDGNPSASFGIFDTEGMIYRSFRVPYGIRETQRKILDSGLPRGLARRLAGGR